VGPSANWIGKTWPAERFIDVIRHITGESGFMQGAKVAVFAAPGEEGQAAPVLASIPENRRIDVIAKGDPGQAAAVIARCGFYIGNDSGLMHCAAASGVPTFGVFGPSYPHLYAPWGDHAAYLQTAETFDQLTDFEGYDPKTLGRTLMSTLLSEDVIRVIDRFVDERVAA
jgi:ADP-heptose:LPS heptosyltransferase